MGYWKISNETINDIKNQLDKFVKTTKNAVIRQAEIDIDGSSYDMKKIVKDSYYLSLDDLSNMSDRMLNDDILRMKKRLNIIKQTKENFEFFISVIEFTTFTSEDFGYVFIFDFERCVVDRVKDSTCPNNQFLVEFRGYRWWFGSKYNWFDFIPTSKQVTFNYYR